MTTITDIEALGCDVPKTRSYGQGTSGDDFMRPFYWAEDVDELLAVIERLVRDYGDVRDTMMKEHEHAEQAEADLTAMTEETAATVVRLTAEIDEYADQLAAAREEAERLNARSCTTCVRPCDTVDESNYQGDEPYYCARYQPGGES